MNLLQQAALLNYDALKSLIEGNYQQSTNNLVRSLALMKEELLSRPEETAAGNIIKNERKQIFSTIEFPIQIELQGEENDRRTNNEYIFNQAFQIPDGATNTTTRQVETTIATVIFNLALVHHLRYINISKENDDSCEAQLEEQELTQRATRLYVMALQLLETDKSCTGSIVQLAAITNLTQIRHCTDIAIDYESYYDITCNALRNLSKSHDEIFEEPKLQGLLLNLLVFSAPKVAPAA